MGKVEKSQLDFFQRNGARSLDHSSIRTSLSRNMLDEFSRDPDTKSIRAFGSTASNTETIFSDMDYSVLVRGDSGLNRAINLSSERYQKIGPLIDWYQYNPYHHYVVFNGDSAPVPLDIYYLPDFVYDNIRKPAETVFDSTQNSQKEKGFVVKMIETSYVKLLQAVQTLDDDDYESTISKIDELRETCLIHLLSEVFHYQIPHIKGIKFENFINTDIKDSFINTYAKPTQESCTKSISNILFILRQVNIKSGYSFDPDSENEIAQAIEQLDLPKIESILFKLTDNKLKKDPNNKGVMSQNGIIKTFRDNDSRHYFITRDDQSLNELLRQPQKMLDSLSLRGKPKFETLSPIHFRFESQSNPTKVDCSIISSGAYYTSIGSSSLVVFEQQNFDQQLSTHTEKIFDRQTTIDKPKQLRELLLKGFIRTYRLLSKMEKNDYPTIAYIVTAIRNEQVIGLIKYLSPSEKESLLQSEDYLNSFPKPTRDDCFQAILSLKNLFTNFYNRYQQLFSDDVFNSFVSKSKNIIDSYQNSAL